MAYPAAQAGSFALLPNSRQLSLTGFLGFLVCAGCINSLIAAVLLCRLPPTQNPSIAALSVRALLYVTLGAVAGVAGAWFYWTNSSSPFRINPPIPFGLFALTSAAGWIWTPSIVLLSQQDSPAPVAMAALSAAILATGLRKVLPPVFTPDLVDKEIFAAALHTQPAEAHGYVIALCMYIGAYELLLHRNFTACAPIALCAFLLFWKLTLAPAHDSQETRNTQAAFRLARIALPALVVTIAALLFGVGHRNHSAQVAAAIADGKGSASGGESTGKSTPQGAAVGISGYESIILWPPPQKKQIVPPLPDRTSLLAPGTSRPLVVRFDGAYWYYQPPGKQPGPRAHQAHGTPLAFNIRASNAIPLTMEAHQNLGSAIRLASCREIQIIIENHDNHPGAISLGILLTDSAAPGKPTLYLGQQPVATSTHVRSEDKPSTSTELLRFSVPAHARIRKFDEITVLFLPEEANSLVAPAIAIRAFELLPR